MKVGRSLALAIAIGGAVVSHAGPTGLNVIPTTDIVPPSSWIGSIQNANTGFYGTPFYRQPLPTLQSQYNLEPWLEAGFDYEQTPDIARDAVVFNIKTLLLTEDENLPNAAFGFWNVTQGQRPGYYLTISKTMNYDQEQDERFKAHHRRNRKLLGRRLHIGAMLDGHGTIQPFAGTDLQLSETAVFQADWVHGPGNSISAGIAYVLSDQRTTITPAILCSNQIGLPNGILLSISHQFNF
jgi:hypothetical protein